MQKITGIACTLLEVKYEELNRIWRKTLIFKLFPLSFVFWHLLWGAGQTPCLVLHGQVLSPFLKKMATAGSQSRAGDFLCKCRDWTESSKQNKFSLQMSRWYHQLLEVTPLPGSPDIFAVASWVTLDSHATLMCCRSASTCERFE